MKSKPETLGDSFEGGPEGRGLGHQVWEPVVDGAGWSLGGVWVPIRIAPHPRRRSKKRLLVWKSPWMRVSGRSW